MYVFTRTKAGQKITLVYIKKCYTFHLRSLKVLALKKDI